MNNRNESVERDALAKLEEDGWIVRTHDEQRRFRGRMSSNEYRVVTHEEYTAAHPGSCPPEKYVIVDEYHTRRVSAKVNRAARPLERSNVSRMIKAVLPASWMDAVADALWAKRTGAEIPAAVTVAEFPHVSVEPPAVPLREIPQRTDAEIPVTTGAEIPAADRRGKISDKACDVQREKTASDSQPANQPPTPENEQTDGRTDGLAASSPSLSLKDKGNGQDNDQWTKFLIDVKADDDIKGWVLYGETEKKVRNAVKEHGADAILEALDDWKENRRPPVSGLDYPWQVFLRECEEEIREWANANRRWKR